MAFWIIILFAAGGAILAYKKSDFYRMWVIIFNILIAIYLAVMLSPWITSMIPPETSGLQYQKAACIIAIAVLVFGLLQTISVNFITNDCEITFPKLFDSIGASSLGFIAGWFAASFLLLMLSILPFADKPFMKGLTGEKTTENLAVKPVVALCDFVTTASIQLTQGKPRYVIDKLTNPQPTVNENGNVTEIKSVE